MFLRRIARPLLAVPFLYTGVQAMIKPAEHLTEAREAVGHLARFTGVPELSDKQLAQAARIHGAATTVAALSLGAGVAPRASALALAGLTTPLALANQPFTLEKGIDRNARMRKFVSSLGLIGAALIAGADYEGKPGVSWRMSHAKAVKAAEREARELAAREAAKHHRRHGRKRHGKATAAASHEAKRAVRHAEVVAGKSVAAKAAAMPAVAKPVVAAKPVIKEQRRHHGHPVLHVAAEVANELAKASRAEAEARNVAEKAQNLTAVAKPAAEAAAVVGRHVLREQA